jgi:hypothetical protein
MCEAEEVNSQLNETIENSANQSSNFPIQDNN